MNRRTIRSLFANLSFIGLFTLVVSVVAPSLAAEPIVIKFSHVVAKDTPKGAAAEFFAKRAGELTKGRVRIDVYPNSTLYRDQDGIEALQMGAPVMLAPSLAKFAPLGVKEFDVFDLPYLFDDYSELHRITQGPVGAFLLTKLEFKGIKGLAYWDNGFKVMSSNKPINQVEDYKGQKMRIQPSKLLDAQMRALDCIPKVLNFSEVYKALQTGAIDGAENPPSNLYSQNMHEVQKYVKVTNHGYTGYAVIVNKRFWDGLPADIRAQLEQAMKEATQFANTIAQKDNDQALELVRKSGKSEVTVPSAADKLALKKALVKVHGEFADRVGRDLLKIIYKETGFDPVRL